MGATRWSAYPLETVCRLAGGTAQIAQAARRELRRRANSKTTTTKETTT